MAVYQFPLDPVLGHRTFIEEGLQRELAALERRLRSEQDEIERLNSLKGSLLAALELKQRETATVSEILIHTTFLERVTGDLDKKREQAAELQRVVNLTRHDLIEAMKKRKTLQRLKEKGWEAFRREENSREQKFFNEVAIGHYSRNR